MNKQQKIWQKEIEELERKEILEEYNESLSEFREKAKLRQARIIFEQRKKVSAILNEIIMMKRLVSGFYGDGGKAEREREAKHPSLIVTVKKKKEVRYETYQPSGIGAPVKIPLWFMGVGDQDHCVENKTDDIAKTNENTRYEEDG